MLSILENKNEDIFDFPISLKEIIESSNTDYSCSTRL